VTAERGGRVPTLMQIRRYGQAFDVELSVVMNQIRAHVVGTGVRQELSSDELDEARARLELDQWCVSNKLPLPPSEET
jgi:hypothetical protein